MAWPDIQKSDWRLFRQYPYRKQIKSNFESGAVQSRVKMTGTRWMFNTGWSFLSAADYTLLATFFDQNIGSTFNWTHILTDAVWIVRFANDQLPEAEPIGTEGWVLEGLILESTKDSSE